MMTMKTPDGTAYELAGPENAPCIVLIYGLGLNRHCWQWTTPALSGDYRVLTYDLFGHGGSAAPPQTPSLKLFSYQLIDLLDHCGIGSAAIIGFSLGGMIARRAAQDAPDRVAALAILHSPHERTDAAQTAILKRVHQAQKEGPASTVDAALGRWFTDDYRQANPAMMDLVRTWVMANNIAIYHRVYKVLADGIAEIITPSPPITCPTLVMTGDEDYGNGPKMAGAIAADIEGAEVHILRGLRHMALAENPDAVNQPLQAFFDRVFKGRAL